MSSQTPPTLYTPPLSGGSDSEPGSFVLVNPQDGYGNGSLGPGSQEPPTRQESSDVEVDATCHISPAQSNRPQPRPRLNSQSSPVANGSNPEGVGTISMSDITHKINTAASENARLRGRLEENNELLDSKLGQFQHHLETKDEEMARLRLEVSQKQQLEDEVARLQIKIDDLQLKLQSVPPVPKPRANLPSMQSLTFQMEGLQGANQVLESEKKELEGKMKKLEHRTTELEQQLQQELESRIVADDDLWSANEKIRDLGAQLRAQAVSVPTGESYEQLHRRNQELVGQLTNLKSQVMQAQVTANENQRLHATADSLTSQMETLQREKRVLASEKRELESKVKELEHQTVEQLQQVSMPVSESYERLHQQNQELVAQLTHFKSQMAQRQVTETENQRLRDEVAAKESRIQTLNDLSRQAELRCAELDKRVMSLQEEVQRKMQELREERSRRGSEGEAEPPHRQGHSSRPVQSWSHKRIEVRLSEALAKVQALENENASLREEKDSQDKQAQVEMTQELEEKDRELALLHHEKDVAEEALSKEKGEIEKLQQQNSFLHQETTDLRQTKEMAEEAFCREKEAKEAMEQALGELQKAKEEAEQTLSEQLAQLQQYQTKLAEKDKLIETITQECSSHKQIQKQISEDAESKQTEIEQLRQHLKRQKSEHESEKQQLVHRMRSMSSEKNELGQVVEEYRRESEVQYQELSAQIVQLQRENADQQQQLQDERASFAQQRDTEIAAYTQQIQQKAVEVQRMNDQLKQLKREKEGLEDRLSAMSIQMEEYSEGFQRERKAREEMAEAKDFLENTLRSNQKDILALRRRCNELSARLHESESEQFDATTDPTSSWADISASSPMGPDPRQTFRGPQLNTSFPPQDATFSPTSPPTQPPGNFPQQSTPVNPRYPDEQQWEQEPPPRARLLTEAQLPRPDIPSYRNRSSTVVHNRASQQYDPFTQSDDFSHQFTHGPPQQFQPTPAAPPQEHAVRFNLPSPPPPLPPQQAPNIAMGGGGQLDQAQWVAIDEVVDENPPAGACPLCGRDDFKTQTEYLVHCARCDP